LNCYSIFNNQKTLEIIYDNFMHFNVDFYLILPKFLKSFMFFLNFMEENLISKPIQIINLSFYFELPASVLILMLKPTTRYQFSFNVFNLNIF